MTKRNIKRPPPPKRQRIEAENDQNAENNANDQHHLTLQKMYDTCQEVLDKQKNLEQIQENMLKEVVQKQKEFEISLVDKLRSVENELQLIRDDLKPKTVTPAVPEENDDEDETDSESDNESATMPTTGKYFVLKHVFKNVSNMKEDEYRLSEAEEHFGVKWRMNVRRTKEHLSFYLNCSKPMDTMNWTIETQRKHVLVSNRVDNAVNECIQMFDKEYSSWGWPKFIKWTVLEKDFLVDGKLTAEVHIKVGKTTGIYKDNLRSFDETMEEFSDVVLVVNEEKFYVLKKFLAAHSSYFKALFLGDFQESDKSEIKLSGIDDDDFQNYLEVLYGEYSIDEFTVEGILLVADMYDTPLVIRKCEQFILKESKKTLKKKLQMSMKYHLEALNKQCRKEIKSVADIKSVLPGDIRDLDPSITTEFLEIALSIQ
ncbi:hypothetical protein GCK72_006859 [Caenorhabditis remanei]|uniref:BTB domain-containing protein n=1 Tax=Caenorhabditis remanei TaxID=31234 RepID=A0A6A5HIE9_CAERE|nr:hypothetical protein GCK72_006859 [Caenorhabditis remanei]KAF1766901.1 hypothetical protein GCK72_006859 [Caenorhabditis remanei]